MNNRKALYVVMQLVLVAWFLSGCASAPPETRAGEWKGSSDFGEFTLVVDPTGMAITQIEYSFPFELCSSNVISGSATFRATHTRDDGGPIATIEDGKFLFEDSGFTTILKGKFDKSGTRASGTWEAGECSGRWTSSR